MSVDIAYRTCLHCGTVYLTPGDLERAYAELVDRLRDPLLRPCIEAKYITWCVKCLRRFP